MTCCAVIKDKKTPEVHHSLKYVDDRLLTMPPVALMQVKKEIDYLFSLVEENMILSYEAMKETDPKKGSRIPGNEEIIDFTNGALTRFLIKLSSAVEGSDEFIIGSYFHVLNDLERVGDHAENFYEIVSEMSGKGLSFSQKGGDDLIKMYGMVLEMLKLSGKVFDELNKEDLHKLDILEDRIDAMKKELTANHFARLAAGNCSVGVSPYYSSTVAGLERVADHLVNVGYSIVSPIGSQNEIQ